MSHIKIDLTRVLIEGYWETPEGKYEKGTFSISALVNDYSMNPATRTIENIPFEKLKIERHFIRWRQIMPDGKQGYGIIRISPDGRLEAYYFGSDKTPYERIHADFKIRP